MNNRNAFVMVSVLLLSIILVTFISTLFFKTGGQKSTHAILLNQAKALHLAKGTMQLALYKFKVLPTEFYHEEEVRKSAGNTIFTTSWMADFDQTNVNSPANKILLNIPDNYVASYALGVNDFYIQAQEDLGYKKDFIRIQTFGTCNQQKKQIEELIEVIRE